MMRPHIQLAHSYWKAHVRPGDAVIDATCGNGHDTLFLSNLVGETGVVIALDIQSQALAATRQLLAENHKTNVELLQESHERFPAIATQRQPALIVYNLGYLPGGDKSITTQTTSTLASVDRALALISKEGMISITCYPGHPEGEKEEEALLAKLRTLPSEEFILCHHRWLNRERAPSLILIKNCCS